MIQKLMKSIREYKTASIKAPVFVSLEVVMECVIPLIMAKLIDQGISAGNMPYIWKAGLVLLLASFASLLFGVLSGKYASVASAGFAKNLRGDMYRQIQTFSFANIDRFSTGGLVTRLTTDVSNVQNAYQMIIRTAVRSPFMLLFFADCGHFHRRPAVADLCGVYSHSGRGAVPGGNQRSSHF